MQQATAYFALAETFGEFAGEAAGSTGNNIILQQKIENQCPGGLNCPAPFGFITSKWIFLFSSDQIYLCEHVADLSNKFIPNVQMVLLWD